MSQVASQSATPASEQPRSKKQRTNEAATTSTTAAGASATAAAATPGSEDEDAGEDAAEEVAPVAADAHSDSDASDASSSSSSDDSDDDSSSDESSSAPAAGGASSEQTRVLHFRNYTPHDPSLRVQKTSDAAAAAAGVVDLLSKDNAWMDGELQSVIESALANSGDDKVLLAITPKPLNWDLKRDLAPKLQQLQTRTTEKIREIIGKEVDKQNQMEASSSDSESSSSSSDDEEEKQ